MPQRNYQLVIHPHDWIITVITALLGVKTHWPPAITPLSERDKPRVGQWSPSIDQVANGIKRGVEWNV